MDLRCKQTLPTRLTPATNHVFIALTGANMICFNGRSTMNPRLPALAVISVAIFLAPVRSPAQAPSPKGYPALTSATKGSSVVKSKTWSPPRPPDGKPDLGGFWTNSTQTPLQRPQAFAGREFLTDDEIKALETTKRDTDEAWKKRNQEDRGAGQGAVGTDPASVAQKKFEADREYHSRHYH